VQGPERHSGHRWRDQKITAYPESHSIKPAVFNWEFNNLIGDA